MTEAKASEKKGVRVLTCHATDCQHNRHGQCVIRKKTVFITSTGQCGNYRYTFSKRETIHKP